MRYLDDDFTDVIIKETGQKGVVVDRTQSDELYYIVELENNDIEMYKPDELEEIK